MPLALVIWAGPVILPPPDATPNVTATPATGFAKGSCTSTAGAIATGVPTAALWLLPALMVIVEAALAFTLTNDWLLPLDAAIGEVAVTVDCAADTAAASTVTVAVWVTVTLPFTFAVTVFGPATVELKV